MSVDDAVHDVQYPARSDTRGIWHPRSWHSLSLLRFGAVFLEPGTRIERNGSGPFWRIEEFDAPIQTRSRGEETWRELETGTILIHPPWTFSERIRKTACNHRYLALMLPEEVPAAAHHSRPIRIIHRTPAMDTSSFSAAYLQRGTLTSSERMRLLSAASSCLAAYLELEPDNREQEPERFPPEVNRAVLLIQGKLFSPVTVEHIASNAGGSSSHLNRLFRRHFGSSVMQYVIRQRVLKAAELLIATESSLEHIADDCGFTTRHYMTRMFTRELGSPPAVFRQEHRLG